ncbi:MAG: ATP-binding cassette domain-containing protein, partial [Paracoccaceae bacterium]|nr:ATP-binding cassette domain-containing protein [Paracoccaceae bacterium]
MTGLLDIRDLQVSIHGKPILKSVSLRIGEGEIVAVTGESGSGKSMTALATISLLPEVAKAEGQIDLQGINLLQQSEAALCDLRGREIGMIFQEPMTALNPVQTIGDQVAETLIVHGAAGRTEALAAAEERLDRVGLGAIGLDRYPHELSGGQRQRVMIAMALAN